MKKQSAGILLYKKDPELKVFLVHPGGPFFAKKDLGVWSIPKGEYEDGEDPCVAAKREFKEETGQEVSGEMKALSPIKMKSGKVVRAWAVEGDIDPGSLISNTFSLEWPPHSDKQQKFPEIDRGDWFDLETAKTKINPAQVPLLEELTKVK
ncbi:MAG TPA: NUDIX domain-containing protein [Candidatus Paceibacterota bacterium]|nr:NUDIX domain-containing protein [Candidatus Paceibacterota bacterium]